MKYLLFLLAFLICTPAAKADNHTRLVSSNGVVHVWTPDKYDREKADLVVYVHGHRTTADKAWKDHKLKKKFDDSYRNSMFVVIEAPSGPGKPVNWKSLKALYQYLLAQGFNPPIRVTAVGHSGAYKTIAYWVDNPKLKKILLLDAMYGQFDKYRRFVARDDTQLWMVSVGTLKNAERFMRSVINTVWHVDLNGKETHMGLVTNDLWVTGFLIVLSD